jgi:hypothetical protein
MGCLKTPVTGCHDEKVLFSRPDMVPLTLFSVVFGL